MYGKTSNINNRGMKNFSDNSKCKFCLCTHPFGRNNCPAGGEKYFECQGMNHFAKSAVCGANTKKNSEKGVGVNKVQGVENKAGALFLGKVGTGQHQNQAKKYEVTITASETNRKIKMKIDTDADVTIIGLNHLHIFGTSIEKQKQSNRKLVGPDKHKFKCHECFTAALKCGSKEMIEVIYV